jgi:hypothetical protein
MFLGGVKCPLQGSQLGRRYIGDAAEAARTVLVAVVLENNAMDDMRRAASMLLQSGKENSLLCVEGIQKQIAVA